MPPYPNPRFLRPALAAALLLSGFLTACGADPTPNPTSPTPTPENPAAPSPTPEGDCALPATPTPEPTPLPPPCNPDGYAYLDNDRDGFGGELDYSPDCNNPALYAPFAGDCNDYDASIYPGATELCDGKDHDCDQLPVLPGTPRFFADHDLDGFGSSLTFACTPTPGYIDAQGDCDDVNPNIHPGAEDAYGDTLDQDCGGNDGPDPHVGLNCRSYPKIQQAILAASAGAVLWIGPGTYRETIRLEGKPITLRGLWRPEHVILDAQGYNSVVQFISGEGPDTWLEGFTITQGSASFGWNGGGIRIIDSSPTLRSLIVRDNYSSASCPGGGLCEGGSGGGIALERSGASLKDLTFFGNRADVGGGLALVDSPLAEVSNLRFYSNTAYSGGALSLLESPTSVSDLYFENNNGYEEAGSVVLNHSDATLQGLQLVGGSGGLQGGALLSRSGQVVLEDSVFSDASTNGGGILEVESGSLTGSHITLSNAHGGEAQLKIGEAASTELSNLVVSGGSSHGALHLGEGRLHHSTFSGNKGFGVVASGQSELSHLELLQNGGGADLSGATQLSHSLVSSNIGTYPAVRVASGSPTLNHCTLVGNKTTAALGGGGLQVLTQDSPGLTLEHSIVAYNWGYNLMTSADAPSPMRITSSCFFNPVLRNHGLGTLETSNREVAPMFFRFSDDGNPANDDLHLPPASPLHGLDPDDLNPDGSPAEAGLYGGPDADRSYYADADRDGLFDGWEAAVSLNPNQNDAGQDPDGDGLTNLNEQAATTDPLNDDTDQDGASDGQEVSAQSSPRAWYSQPGTDAVVAHVPGDFDSLQEALSAITDRATIDVTGTLTGGGHLENKGLVLRSSAQGTGSVSGAGGQVLQLTATELELTGLTLQDGSASSGAGLEFIASVGTITDARFQNNHATGWGGGLAVYGSTLTLDGVTFLDNIAEYSGGGLLFMHSSLHLQSPSFTNNMAGSGGGFYGESSSLTLLDGTVQGNRGDSAGGGGTLIQVEGSIQDTRFSKNTWVADQGWYTMVGAGGGLYIVGGALDLLRSQFIENKMDGEGGGIYVASGAPRIRYCTFQGNRAQVGGGIVVKSGTSDLQFLTLVDNQGSGLWLNYDAPVSVRSCILAYNHPANIERQDSRTDLSQVVYNNVFNADARTALDPSLDDTNLHVTPGFIAWSNNGTASDDDLHLTTGSLMRDAAEPGTLDPDGSPADLGAYGGPESDRSYYEDLDQDGLYDAWELQHGLNPAVDDSAQDGDADGLTNTEELELGTDPGRSDSDDDGASDGTEAGAGTDPLDFFAQPGVSGYGTATVPTDFPSIQAAVNAMLSGGIVAVRPGTYSGTTTINYKQVELYGLAGATKTTLNGNGGVSLLVMGGTLALDGFTVTGGAGITLTSGSGTLSHLVLTENPSGALRWSGGVYSLSDSVVTDNPSYALILTGGSMLRTEVSGNLNTDVGPPVLLSNMEVRSSIFRENSGLTCGVVISGEMLIDHSAVIGNIAAPVIPNSADEAAGLCIGGYGGTVKLYNSVFAYNAQQNVGIWSGITYAQVQILSSLLYNPTGYRNIDTGYVLDASNSTLEPKFLTYSETGLPLDLHPLLNSPLVGLGTENDPDVDDSDGDAGIYGGALGNTWDRDEDGLFDYFWPGTFTDAPSGILTSIYDCNDQDPDTGSAPCPSARQADGQIPADTREMP